ncbi:MAG: hypothetical protein AAF658_03545 [Myxococcota bacterium]
MRNIAPPIALAALCGCGGFTDTGSGSGTLEVEVDTSYALEQNRTEVRVDVRVSSGDPASAGVVVRDDESGEVVELDVTLQGVEAARYRGSFEGYRQRLELEVERGNDELTARLEGPGRHVIENPANGSVLSVSSDLDIEWSVEDGLSADAVTIELDDSGVDVTVSDDDGDFEVDEDSLEAGEETVSIERINIIVLDGGLPGSSWEFSYEVENDFVLE